MVLDIQNPLNLIIYWKANYITQHSLSILLYTSGRPSVKTVCSHDGPQVFKDHCFEGAAKYVHNDSTMNASGRHVSNGHYESQSPDGPQILPQQVAGPISGTTGCLGRRHHGKCGLVVHLKGQGRQGTFSFTAACWPFRARTPFLWKAGVITQNSLHQCFLKEIRLILYFFCLLQFFLESVKQTHSFGNGPLVMSQRAQIPHPRLATTRQTRCWFLPSSPSKHEEDITKHRF